MISDSSLSPETNDLPPSATKLKIPRLRSLEHRLQHAKDADGQPIDLIDELLFFLDDPPAGTTDRWQAGADLCAEHGIKTSRMAVWRFYRAHIFQWRREQLPPPPAAPIDPQEIERLHDQARLLAAQRVLEMLNDPNLSPGQLIAILQNENQREKQQIARDQFNDVLYVRHHQATKAMYKAIDDAARDRAIEKAFQEKLRRLKARQAAQQSTAPSTPIPPHTTK